MADKQSKIYHKSRVNRGRKERKVAAEKSKTLSSQALLNRFFWSGVFGLIAGVLSGLLIYKLNLPVGWYLLTVGISGIGLVMLVSAWFTRQGLVHGRLMKLMIRLMNTI
jgi:hypothetical protein